MVDEGKRDPEWVSKVLQNAIENTPDGFPDIDCERIDLGEVEVDYSLSLEEMLEGTSGHLHYPERFQNCLWAADEGSHKVHMGLVCFSFGGSWTMFRGDMIRAQIRRNGFYNTQLPELIAACKHMAANNAKSAKVHDIMAMGPGISIQGGTSNLPETIGLVDELVPRADIWPGNEIHLSTEIVRCLDDRYFWYLVRFGIKDHPTFEEYGY
jgi:hypothetical protein